MKILISKKSLVAAGLLLLFVVAAAQLPAQSAVATAPPPAPLHFDVISVRPHKNAGDEPSNRRIEPGGRFTATATSARTLIRIVFGTDDVQIKGLPKWVDDQTFDVTATTADHADVKTPQQFQQLLLQVLQERFGLKYHTEQKEVPVYWLELVKLGKLGPALKPSAPESVPNMSSNGGLRSTLRVVNMSMADIAAGLRRQAGRPVEDHTGLNGNYDLELHWSADETPESTDPSLGAALKEQLGLKLQPAKGMTESFVIDQLTQPTEN